MLRLRNKYATFARYRHTVIGIDLGTTNSAVALVQSGQCTVLSNEEGHKTTPSIVAFSQDSVLVGLPAKRQAMINPQNTFFATKRLIGRKYLDSEVQRDLKNVPYKIVSGDQGDAWLQTTGKDLKTDSVGVDNAGNGSQSGEVDSVKSSSSASILDSSLLGSSTSKSGSTMKSGSTSKSVTSRSISPSEISGLILNKMKLIAQSHTNDEIKHAVVTVPAYFNDSQRQATKNSGLAAGLNILRVVNEPTAAALAYGIDKKNDGIVAVFDLGGGTFDISILDIEEGVFEVRATNGNTHLGGEDFDILLLDYVLNDFKIKNNQDLSQDKFAVQRIREACEKAKIELSHIKETEINLPFITKDKHVKLKLTEDELDSMSLHLIEKCIDPVKKCLRDAELKPKDIDEVILVGGMTRMPRIRTLVKDLFGKKPRDTVNPDEAVAIGAAIQGAILSGQVKDVVLLDVTPLSLGIETYGGIFSPLIPRNTPVPAKKVEVFSTAVDNQTGVQITVYQGERSLVKDNSLIGKFNLTGIPPGPKGSPQVAVSFSIDADGIISVSASDKTQYPEGLEYHNKSNSASIQVHADTTLSEEEIERIVAESSKLKDEDDKMRKYYEHASRAEILCTDTDNAIEQFGKLMETGEKELIIEQIASVKQKIKDIRENRKLHSPDSLNNELNAMQKTCLEAIKKVAAKQNNERK